MARTKFSTLRDDVTAKDGASERIAARLRSSSSVTVSPLKLPSSAAPTIRYPGWRWPG